MSQITSKILFEGLKIDDSILTDEVIEDIKERAADYFSRNANLENKLINLEKFNNRLKEIGAIIEKNIQMYETKKPEYENNEKLRQGYSSDSSKGKILQKYNFYKNNYINKINKEQTQTEINKVIIEAYYLIMKFRETILKEKVNYGVYFSTGKFDTAELVDISEENILHLLKVDSNNNIILNTSQTLLNNIKNFNENNTNTGFEIQSMKSQIYNNFFNKIEREDFDLVNTAGKAGRYVKIDIVFKTKKFESLRNNFLLKETINTSNKHRVSFNRGHIAEAFDIAYDKLKIQSLNYNYQELRMAFYKNLYYDQVKATKGGDNSIDIENQRSIKAYSANVYKIESIYGDLIILTDMLDAFSSQKINKTYVKNRIKNLFIESSKYSSGIQKANQIANKKINEAFEELFRGLKT